MLLLLLPQVHKVLIIILLLRLCLYRRTICLGDGWEDSISWCGELWKGLWPTRFSRSLCKGPIFLALDHQERLGPE